MNATPPSAPAATVSVPFLPVPPELLRLSNERNALRSACATALKWELAPIIEDCGGLPRRPLAIPPALRAKIDLLVEKNKDGLQFQDVFAGLVRAGFQAQMRAIREAESTASGVSDPPFAVKSGTGGSMQKAYWRHVMGSLGRGRVVVAEGSTGLGKGRVIVAAALEKALSGKGAGPVYVVAPTLKIVGQLWAEYEELRDSPGGRSRWAGITARFLPGMTEFASPEKIKEYLDACSAFDDASEIRPEWNAEGDGCDRAVARWFEGGGMPLDDAGPLQRALRLAEQDGVPMRFLMDDLRQIATEVEPQTLACDDAEDARVISAKHAAKGAQIVFCTHAMLCILHKVQWAGWAPPSCLLIDEAHEFERIAASIYSHGVALRALRRRLVAAHKEKRLGKSSMKDAVRLVARIELQCRILGEGSALGADRVRIGPDTGDAFWSELQSLGELLKSAAYKRVPGLRNVHLAIRSILRVPRSPGLAAWIEFSPKRTYPSLVAGRSSMGGILGSLWSKATSGVALCSATLLIPDGSGNRRADYIQDVLALPPSRTDVPPSVVAPSILEIPALHAPRKAHQAALLSRPPRKLRDANPELETKWLSTLSRTIGNITNRPDIAGGSLVLLSSYRQADAVANALDSDRVILQSANERFADAQARFEAAYRAGKKPILLGVGAAWTGVDLADKHEPDPAQDFLLTDLIIGCMPVGLNRSATMMHRIDRMGTMPIEKEALMTLRQGLGRLIRRDGVTHRHIWFLDGRLWGAWRGMERFQAAARQMLGEYRQQKGI